MLENRKVSADISDYASTMSITKYQAFTDVIQLNSQVLKTEREWIRITANMNFF